MPVSHLDPASCLLKFSISHWAYVNELWDLAWQTAHTQGGAECPVTSQPS